MYFSVERADSRELCNKLSSEILASADLNWMALVDGAFDLDNKDFQDCSNKEILFKHAGFQDVSHASPYLLRLKTDDEKALKIQLRALVEYRGNRPMLSFLSTRYSEVDICRRWKDFVNVWIEAEQEFILRFADTRIMEILPSCLSRATWAGLSNMLDSWWYINRSGKLDFLPISKEKYVMKDRVELTSAEFSSLVERCEPDAIVDFLYRNQSELLENRSAYSIFRRVKAVSEFSQRNSITLFSDVVALATFDLAFERPIEASPTIENLILSQKWKPGRLIDMLVDMVDENV